MCTSHDRRAHLIPILNPLRTPHLLYDFLQYLVLLALLVVKRLLLLHNLYSVYLVAVADYIVSPFGKYNILPAPPSCIASVADPSVYICVLCVEVIYVRECE